MTARPAGDPDDLADEPAEVPPPRPSPRWFGFVLTFALLLSIVWLLGYTLLDLGWQQRMGAWNYLIAFGFSTVFSQMLQRWRGNPAAGRR
jgi:hypothetical protein